MSEKDCYKKKWSKSSEYCFEHCTTRQEADCMRKSKMGDSK